MMKIPKTHPLTRAECNALLNVTAGNRFGVLCAKGLLARSAEVGFIVYRHVEAGRATRSMLRSSIKARWAKLEVAARRHNMTQVRGHLDSIRFFWARLNSKAWYLTDDGHAYVAQFEPSSANDDDVPF